MKKIIFLLFLASILFVNCKGEGGEPGPTGNANVKTSFVTFRSSDWTATGTGYEAETPYVAIDPFVNNFGNVQMYLGINGVWYNMPLVIENIQYNYAYSLGKIGVLISSADGSSLPAPSNHTFKVVVIPPAN